MSRIYRNERIRFIAATDSSADLKDALTSTTPDMWRGMGIAFELVVRYADELADLANVQSITFEAKDPENLDGLPVFMRSISAGNLNLLLLEENAGETGTDQHCTFRFTPGEMLLDLKGKPSKAFWVFIWATTTMLDQDGNTVPGRAPIGKTLLTVRESGATLGLGNVPVVGSNVASGLYDGSGNKVITTVPNMVYDWTKNGNDLTLINGAQTLTVSGRFTAVGASVTLTGTAGAAVTAFLRTALFVTWEEFRAITSNLAKAIGEPGETRSLRSPDGTWMRVSGIDNDGNVFDDPIRTPVTP